MADHADHHDAHPGDDQIGGDQIGRHMAWDAPTTDEPAMRVLRTPHLRALHEAAQPIIDARDGMLVEFASAKGVDDEAATTIAVYHARPFNAVEGRYVAPDREHDQEAPLRTLETLARMVQHRVRVGALTRSDATHPAVLAALYVLARAVLDVEVAEAAAEATASTPTSSFPMMLLYHGVQAQELRLHHDATRYRVVVIHERALDRLARPVGRGAPPHTAAFWSIERLHPVTRAVLRGPHIWRVDLPTAAPPTTTRVSAVLHDDAGDELLQAISSPAPRDDASVVADVPLDDAAGVVVDDDTRETYGLSSAERELLERIAQRSGYAPPASATE